jgi:hypothetical protein
MRAAYRCKSGRLPTVQQAIAIVIVLLGCVHFADRDRPQQARRQYYLGTPSSVAGRTALALVEVALGFVLLFTA